MPVAVIRVLVLILLPFDDSSGKKNYLLHASDVHFVNYWLVFL